MELVQGNNERIYWKDRPYSVELNFSLLNSLFIYKNKT